jgi:predicted MPP superfamily phosphohydrolase
MLTVLVAQLPSSLPAPLFPVLFAGACLGNFILFIAIHNWFYGTALPRLVSGAIRHSLSLVSLALPALFWYFYGFDLGIVLDGKAGSVGTAILTAYLVLCWVIAAGVFPVVTLYRCLRRRPALVLSNHTNTVDVAERLKYRPYGNGKHPLQARLPFNEIFQVDFSERTFSLPQLPPAWDGLTILHLSDFHFCGTPDRSFFRQVIDLCNDWQPDLVAFTGDLVDSKRHHRWIVPVLGRLRWRIAAFAILGNHDHWYDVPLVRRRLRRLGMRVLANTWEQIDVKGVPLTVIGHEGPWLQPAPDLTACPSEGFRLCLSHTPDNIAWARRNAIDLMLSGHNHGGQVRFPVIGSVFVPSLYGRRYDCGIFHEPPTLLHVSRGLGGEHPMRYNCRPEVTKIVLRASPLGASL